MKFHMSRLVGIDRVFALFLALFIRRFLAVRLETPCTAGQAFHKRTNDSIVYTYIGPGILLAGAVTDKSERAQSTFPIPYIYNQLVYLRLAIRGIHVIPSRVARIDYL